jgi:hypothetical protein
MDMVHGRYWDRLAAEIGDFARCVAPTCRVTVGQPGRRVRIHRRRLRAFSSTVYSTNLTFGAPILLVMIWASFGHWPGAR